MQGVVVMVIEGLLFKGSPLLLGKGKGWWSCSYSFLFWKREGAVVRVIHSLLLRRCPHPLGQSEPAQLTIPLLSHLKYTAFLWKAPLLFLEREEVVAMVRQGLLFKSSLLQGKERGGIMVTQSLLL